MIENRHLRRLHLRRRRNPESRARRSRPSLLLLPLLALAIQLFVVQTHIHAVDFAGQAIRTISAGLNGNTAPAGFPVKNDSANCPLCQAFAHAGGFLHATQLSTLLPAFGQDGAIRIDATAAPDLHVSHSWFGRAPPSHPVAL